MHPRLTLTTAAVLAAGVLVAGCGTASSGGAVATASPVTAHQLFLGTPSKALCQGKQYLIGYDAFTDSNPTTQLIKAGAQRVARDLGCIDLLTTVNNASPTTALENAQSFVQRKVTGAVLFNLTPAAAAGQMKILDRAHAATVQIGAPAPGAPFITVDENKAGRTAGTELAKGFKAKYVKQTPYVLVGRADETGPVYIQYMNQFVAGIRSVIPNIPHSQIISVATQADPAVAESAARSALGGVPPSAPILAMGINDDTTGAILQAVKEANRSGPVMVIAGRGSTASVPEVCRSSQFVGMVDYHFDRWADYFIPAVIDVAQGRRVPSVVSIPLTYSPRSALC